MGPDSVMIKLADSHEASPTNMMLVSALLLCLCVSVHFSEQVGSTKLCIWNKGFSRVPPV